MAGSYRHGGAAGRTRRHRLAVRRIGWLWMLLAGLAPGAAQAGPARQSAPTVLCDGRTLDGAAGAARLIIRDTSNALIRNCTFRNFTRDPIVIERSSDIVIENSRFENNRTATERRDTHGINIPAEGQRIIIRNNVFVNNGGDGVQMGDTAAEENRGNIRDIQILGNSFTVTGEDIGENGIDIKRTHGPVLVAGNTIHGFRPCESSQMGCTGAPGEGIVVHMGAQDVTIERNTIYDNVHGISIGDGFIPIPPRNILVRNNWISANQGRGITISRAHSVRLVNNTLVNNARHLAISETPVSSDGVCLNSNNLFAGGPAPSVVCNPQSNLYHAAAGDAAFANLAGGDFHLTAGSPAANRGQTLSLVPQDFDGQPRPSGPAADIGADELAAPAGCLTATASAWKSIPLAAPQRGAFSVEGALTPPAAATSGAFAVAASAPAAGGWADLAAIVLFDDQSGTIKARDGAAYRDAPTPLRFQAGAAYRIRLTINVAAKTYAATVTPPGGGAVALGSALRFRETQSNVASLGQIVVAAGASSSITGCAISAQLPPPAAATRFGVIGDFGNNSSAERDVAQRVRSWNPDFVVTVGDNNYEAGAASTIDANIGQYYQEFIFPYAGRFGGGSPTGANRFFPALGNHDWESAADRDGAGPQPALPHPHLDYFQLPGNERYYEIARGPVQLFVLDSDPREPDGTSATSAQAQWLRQRLAASTAPWKLVALHHAPFSSSTAHGSTARLQWPFQEWGAHAVLAGHDHAYERIMKNGMPYFVNGIGGGGLRDSFASPPVSGSQIRFAGDHGALLVEADAASITFKAVTRAGAQLDSLTLTKPATAAPFSGEAPRDAGR